MEDKDLLQEYTNKCAELGNTQTLIQMLRDRMQSLVRDLEKLDKKYKEQVELCLSLRNKIDEGHHER